MQTELLFELTYILLEKKNVTAKEMAEHFGVSTRTIYRWVDALDLAGIPIITTKGKGGGISLSENYALDKAVLTEDEKLEILSSVQALEVLGGKQNSALSKLKAITKASADWIKVDFAPWNPKGMEVRNLFNQLKSAILLRQKVIFDYYSAKGECTKRKVEPWKIVFKGQAWYLYGFCGGKNEPRYFKLSRMQNCTATYEKVIHEEKDFPEDRHKNENGYYGYDEENFKFVTLKFEVEVSCVFMIVDEYSVEKIEDCPEQPGRKIITMKVPDMSWIINWILGFGSQVKVLEPENIKLEVQKEAKKILNAF